MMMMNDICGLSFVPFTVVNTIMLAYRTTTLQFLIYHQNLVLTWQTCGTIIHGDLKNTDQTDLLKKALVHNTLNDDKTLS